MMIDGRHFTAKFRAMLCNKSDCLETIDRRVKGMFNATSNTAFILVRSKKIPTGTSKGSHKQAKRTRWTYLQSMNVQNKACLEIWINSLLSRSQTIWERWEANEKATFEPAALAQNQKVKGKQSTFPADCRCVTVQFDSLLPWKASFQFDSSAFAERLRAKNSAFRLGRCSDT